MHTGYLRKLRFQSRDVRLYLTSVAVSGFTQEGVRGVLYNLYLLRLGYGPQFIGLVGAVGALAFTLACFLAGALGTRLGGRRVMTAGAGLMLVGSILLPLVESTPPAWWTLWLLMTSALGGLGMALLFVNGIPFVMSATRPEERDYAFSLQMTLIPLATFAGSLIGGILPGVFTTILGSPPEDPASYRYSLLLVALLLSPVAPALLAATSAEVRPGPASEPLEETGAAPLGPIIVIGLVAAFHYAGQATAVNFYNVYLDAELQISTALIGVLKAAGQLLAAPAAMATPLLIARWRRKRTIVVGSLGQALGQSVLALIPHWCAAGLGYTGLSASFTVTSVAFRVFSQELVSPVWRTAMSVALMAGAGLSASAMAFSGGFVITALGYVNLFLIGAGLTTAGAALFWLYFAGRGTSFRQ